MIPAKLPDNENERLSKLDYYEVLDSLPESEFDEITELVSKICGVPIALISLIDRDRQWFKSKYGLDSEETSRDISFCGHAILEDKIFLVENALKDERFEDNPLVTGDLGVRFYAGAQLKTEDGHNIGTLCIIDREKGKLSELQKRTLEIMANQVIRLLELRLQNKKLKEGKDLRNNLLLAIVQQSLQLESDDSSESKNSVQAPVKSIRAVFLNSVLDYLKYSSSEKRLVEKKESIGQVLNDLPLNLPASCELNILNHLDKAKLKLEYMKLEQVLLSVICFTHYEYGAKKFELKLSKKESLVEKERLEIKVELSVVAPIDRESLTKKMLEVKNSVLGDRVDINGVSIININAAQILLSKQGGRLEFSSMFEGKSHFFFYLPILGEKS